MVNDRLSIAQVYEMILEVHPSIKLQPDKIKSVLTSNLACVANLRKKDAYYNSHDPYIADNLNGR